MRHEQANTPSCDRTRRLSAVIKECPHPILRVTTGLSVDYANPASRKMLPGLKAREGSLLPEPLRKTVELCFSLGSKVEGEVKLGERVYSFAAVPSSEADIVYVYGLDIRQRKAAEQALKQCDLRYRELVETVSDWVWEIDQDMVYTYSSPSVETLLGYKPQEVIGKTPFDFLLPEAAQKIKKAFLFYYDKRLPFHGLKNEAMKRDGGVVILETNGEPVFDAKGGFQGYRGIDRDISLRKKAEQALKQAKELLEHRVLERTAELQQAVVRLENESKEHHRTRNALELAVKEKEAYRQNLETVFQSIPDAIVTVGMDMKILNANKKLGKFCARANEIVPGKPLPTFENGSPACALLFKRTLDDGEAIRMYRTECRCGTRTNQVVLLNSSVLRNDSGQQTGAVMVIRDISQLAALEKRLQERTHYGGIIGKSNKIQEMYAVLEQLADLDTTVLITGESGTGKELVVEALHYSGSRLTGPLIKVNCSALSEGLLETELFGHVRGAFTGAVNDKIGRFQAAEGGTIFLDEIGDISPAIQLKLLRVLERKELERVGESTTQKVDVRVVAATNANLSKRVQEGGFRADLYYRLRVMVIDLPPLRDRVEDIPLLVDHFIALFNQVFGKNILGVENEVMEVFLRNPWPGNVRELKHSIEHACILCPTGHIGLEHLPTDLVEQHIETNALLPLDTEPEKTDQKRILNVLAQTHWNKSHAAKALGISRTTLYRWMREFDIKD